MRSLTPALRTTLILVSLLTFFFVTRRVRNSKVRLEDSIFWFSVSGLLLLVSIFPQIFYLLSDVVGTYSTVNFVFLFFIFVLLIQVFTLTMRVSQSDTKIRELSQRLAIEQFERHQAADDSLRAKEGE